MKIKLLVLVSLCMLFLLPTHANPVKVVNLRREFEKYPIGTGTWKPNLRWIFESEQKVADQISYQIIVESTLEKILKK